MDEQRTPIVEPAGPSGRTRLLIAFMVVDVLVVATLVWYFTR